MSSDNGIYILKTHRTMLENKPGCWVNNSPNTVWRLAYTSAIDNFDYYKENAIYNLGAYMKEIWGKSKVYNTLADVLTAANKLEAECLPTEYGIVIIDATEFVFYGDH